MKVDKKITVELSDKDVAEAVKLFLKNNGLLKDGQTYDISFNVSEHEDDADVLPFEELSFDGCTVKIAESY